MGQNRQALHRARETTGTRRSFNWRPKSYLMAAFDHDFQTVVGQPYRRRQRVFRLLVRQVMADVCKESSPGRELCDRLNRPLNGGMRGVRLVTQGVQKEHIQAAQAVHRLLRNVAVIREIRGATKAETVNRRTPVQQTDGRELQTEKVE